MKADELLTIVQREVESALGVDADNLASKRANALNYYKGIMPDAAEGRSNIVSYDVADTVHALLAQITPILQSTLINFTPESEQDEPQAQLESDAVRYEIEKCGGYEIISEAVADALLMGNGWMHVDVESSEDTETERYEGEFDDLTLLNLSAPTAPNQEVYVTEQNDGVSIKRVTTTRRLTVNSIAPENMVYSASHSQFRLKDLRLVGQRVLYSTSDLIGMGVKRADALAVPLWNEDNETAQRDRPYDESDEEATQDAERLHACYNVYIRLDKTENGVSELRRVLYGGDILIEDDPAEYCPYVTGSPIPMPHRVTGQGMYEVMKQVQDSKTHTLRNYLDNLNIMNGSRMGVVEGQVNLEDATNGRINGIVRMRSPNAIMPLPANDIGPQAITGLNYFDSMREQRGGASVEMSQADRQVMAASATAASGMMAANEKMAGWYCSNLTHTLLKSMFKLVHTVLRTDMEQPISAKLRGKWQQVNPAEWPEREHMEVTGGMTTTKGQQKQMGLQALISQQQQLIAAGYEGIITDKGKTYNAMADWIRATDIGQPEEYLIDPDSPEALQAEQQKAQASQQQQEQQQQFIQMQVQLEQQKVELDRVKAEQENQFKYYQQDGELKFKYYDTNVDAGVKEAEMVVDGTLQVAKEKK